MCGMFMRSAWKVTSSTNSAKVGNASQPFFCCRVCSVVDHFVKIQLGAFPPGVIIADFRPVSQFVFKVGSYNRGAIEKIHFLLSADRCELDKSVESCFPDKEFSV